MSGLAEQFAAELTAAAGTPHAGADPAGVALEIVGPPPALVAIDDDAGLDFIALALQRAGHEIMRPDHPEWEKRLPDAHLGVTGCTAALADTGTLLLLFGPGRPRATSLVPRVHLAVVEENQLVDSLPAALARVPGAPPSGLAFITGPSRSGDIEQIITLGVHGPAAVHVVLP